MGVKEVNAAYSVTQSASVPKGYKQTEVGVIPEDWEVTTVGAEFSIQLGKMLDGEKNVGTLKPFLGNRAIQWGYIDVNDIGFIRLTPSDIQRFRLRNGDLLVCEGGEVGRAAIWDAPIEECYYQKALHRLRPTRGFSVSLMLNMLQWLSSKDVLQNFVTQTSIAHLPKDKFQTVPIPKPGTTSEQKAIAEALSDADALIESFEQFLTKKRQLKQGAMQELLTGKKRLPGFSGEWGGRLLGQLASVQRGASPRPIDSPIWFDGNSLVGWVRISDVTNSKMYLTDTTQRLSDLGIKNSRPVESGSLIMSICATVGRPVITAIEVCIHDGFVVFDGLKVDQLFLYYVLKFIEPDWSRYGQTGSQMNLNTALINKTFVPVPNDEQEQTAIATILSDMDAELATLEEKLTKACAAKQGMMQELLTGRIRLVNT